MEKNYWAIQMGEQGRFAEDAYQKNYIAIDWHEIGVNLNKFIGLTRLEFFNKVRILVQNAYPDRGVNAIGQYMGQLFRFSNEMKIGDVVLLKQLTEGKVILGIIESDYLYDKIETDNNYKYQRRVRWIKSIETNNISQELRNTIGAIMTVFNISPHADELDKLIGKNKYKEIETENVKEFGLESHLESFIIKNWDNIELGKKYKIFEDSEGKVGQQYVTRVGRIDILAKSIDDTEWLVIELKKGKEDDRVVGQVLKYMGWIKKNEAKSEESVKGLIITKDTNDKLVYALETIENVSLMTYEVDFRLREEN